MTRRGHIIGPGGWLENGTQRFAIAIVDLDAEMPRPELLAIDFLGHGVAIDPLRPHEAAVFEKKGPGACRVDLRARSVIEPITTAPSRRFYGHGVYSAD